MWPPALFALQLACVGHAPGNGSSSREAATSSPGLWAAGKPQSPPARTLEPTW